MKYYNELSNCSACARAIFLAIVFLMDFFVVALLITRSFDMFLSPIGTWIPFTLIVRARSRAADFK
jgi:hypothetical protein